MRKERRYRAELGLWTSALKLLGRPVVLRRMRLFPFQLRLGEFTRCFAPGTFTRTNWRTANDNVPLTAQGPGLIDRNLYTQTRRMILHLANLNSATWRAPVEDFIPIGPVKVRVRLSEDVMGHSARLMVAAITAPVTMAEGWAEFVIPTVVAHQVEVLH